MIYTPSDSTELAAIVTTTGDTVLLRSGVTYAASSIPAALLSPSGVTLGASGTGTKPIISGGTVRSDWTLDAPNSVYSRTYASNILGNVTEDGVPMKYVAWDTDIATTAAAMTDGASLPYWSGSMTYDPANFIVYIRPSSGAASAHVYVVSDSANADGTAIYDTATGSGLLIDGIELRNISRTGIHLFNKKSAVISDCDFRVIGGIKPASLWIGNGLELSQGCNGVQVLRCDFQDIFDSAMTSQLYEGTRATIGWHLYEDNTVSRYGMHGVEISLQTANQFITDIEVSGLTAADAGTYSWAGDRNGAAVTMLSNSAGSSRVTRAYARGVQATRAKRLYLGYQHGGVCGIEDSAGVETWGFAPVSNANGVSGQVDLWRSVTDNLGAPSGGNWVASTARMSNAFRGMTL